MDAAPFFSNEPTGYKKSWIIKYGAFQKADALESSVFLAINCREPFKKRRPGARGAGWET